MLKEHGADYEYREYTEDPLSRTELKAVFEKLKLAPSDLLRRKEARDLGLTGDESAARLIALMAEHPTLLQRPIAVKGARAVVGRPVETIETLL